MNKLKQKIQDGTINIPGIIIKIALIWFIITFLVFPNLNLLARVFVKDGHFTLEAIDKIMKSAKGHEEFKEQLCSGNRFYYYRKYIRYFSCTVYRIL